MTCFHARKHVTCGRGRIYVARHFGGFWILHEAASRGPSALVDGQLVSASVRCVHRADRHDVLETRAAVPVSE